ncbi:MAG TPA: hypothetical protein VNZ26_06690 [Vicinamibacterales bacterium]|jgi:hypothetical protein|nr:hypothetical protein [Vicinamibacterales bacterium]
MSVWPTVGVLVSIGVAAVAAIEQLTERPLIGALAHPAIEYASRPTSDPIVELNRRIDQGTVRLTFDEGTGYLRSVLDALKVPIESQMLVMSKTGVQALYTGPDNPRAIFFDDSVTVGYIRGAPLLELAVHDPQQGVIFYTTEQKPQASVQFERPSSCLRCHVAYNTLHVPGMLARSVFIAPDGLPLSQFGSYDADDRTPFSKRWGGWYVTGTHGSMRHLGNAIVGKGDSPETIVSDRTLNRTAIETFDHRGYLSGLSDIAALMVFEHQSHVTNLITRLGWEARIAAHEHHLDLASTPLRDGIGELVDYMLFVDEQPLSDALQSTSGFVKTFEARGPVDSRGRSLRQLDLKHRLVKYPCSYMIYSAAFRALPTDVRHAVYKRMWEILSGSDTAAKYARLDELDRHAIIEILRETIADWPSEFATLAERTRPPKPLRLRS